MPIGPSAPHTGVQRAPAQSWENWLPLTAIVAPGDHSPSTVGGVGCFPQRDDALRVEVVLMTVEIRPATAERFHDVETMLGPKRSPDAIACWCLIYQLGLGRSSLTDRRIGGHDNVPQPRRGGAVVDLLPAHSGREATTGNRSPGSARCDRFRLGQRSRGDRGLSPRHR